MFVQKHLQIWKLFVPGSYFSEVYTYLVYAQCSTHVETSQLICI